MKYLVLFLCLFLISVLSFSQTEHIYLKLKNGDVIYVSSIKEIPYLITVTYDTVNFSSLKNKKIVEASGDTIWTYQKSFFSGYQGFNHLYETYFSGGYLDENMKVRNVESVSEGKGFSYPFAIFGALILIFGFLVQGRTYERYTNCWDLFKDAASYKFMNWLIALSSISFLLYGGSIKNGVGLWVSEPWFLLFILCGIMVISIWISSAFFQTESSLRNSHIIMLGVLGLGYWFQSGHVQWLIISCFYPLGVLLNYMITFKRRKITKLKKQFS